ncbi:MAG: hypothetical protein JW829_20355 [Pirellulales bacterium]|nr:hypothetical protein [Pirellulales bacterium]
MNGRLPHLTACFVAAGAMGLLAVAFGRGDGLVGQPSIPESLPLSELASDRRPSGNRLVAAAEATLLVRKSIAARVRFRVRMFESDLAGSGFYLQSGVGEEQRFRWELRMRVAETTSTLVQVCDGRFIWTDRILPTGPRITRLDLRRNPPRPGQATAKTTPPAADSVLPMLATQPRHSGLARLLASLVQHYQFSLPRRSILLDVPVYVVYGRLITSESGPIFPARRESEHQAPEAGHSSLGTGPAATSDTRNIPQQIRLVLGQEDLFPYRLEYFNTPGSLEKQATPDALALRIEWYEVQLDGQVDERRFYYSPPTPNWTNVTDNQALFHGSTR